MSTHLSTAPHQSRKKRELTRAVEPLKFRNGAPGVRRTNYHPCKAFGSVGQYYKALMLFISIANVSLVCVHLCVHEWRGR